MLVHPVYFFNHELRKTLESVPANATAMAEKILEPLSLTARMIGNNKISPPTKAAIK